MCKSTCIHDFSSASPVDPPCIHDFSSASPVGPPCIHDFSSPSPVDLAVAVAYAHRYYRRCGSGISIFYFSICTLCCVNVTSYLFRQNTYLQNKKHMLTCQGGDWLLQILITSPVVGWRGCETPPQYRSSAVILCSTTVE